MTREQIYRQQMEELGIWSDAFAPAVHVLAIQERELTRMLKAWRTAAKNRNAEPSVLDPIYAQISALRRDILQRQDALGLTPKGLQRLRRGQPETEVKPQAGGLEKALQDLADKVAAYD